MQNEYIPWDFSYKNIYFIVQSVGAVEYTDCISAEG